MNLLLHRLTPFLLGAALLGGFGVLIMMPFSSFNRVAAAAFLLVPLLLGRLLLWDVRRPGFWVFFATPMFLIISALFIFSLLVEPWEQWTLAVATAGAVGVYAECLFAFYHAPSAYQAYSLEYLTLTLLIAGFFLFTSGTFLAQFFLELPLWAAAPTVAILSVSSLFAVLWVSKAPFSAGLPFAVVGGMLLGELYLVMSLLPTTFLVNAGVFAVGYATIAGVARARVAEKLTFAVARRYAVGALVGITIFLLTATWL